MVKARFIDFVFLCSFDEICVAFNGGKDCNLLVHMFHAFMDKRWREQQRENDNGIVGRKIKALYVAGEKPFQEVEDFISDCITR